MDELQGGSCSSGNEYSNCNGSGTYTVCRARSVLRFSSQLCNGGNTYLICGSDMYYATHNCPSGSATYSGGNCPSQQTGYIIS